MNAETAILLISSVTEACWASTTLVIVFAVGHISGYWRAYRHILKDR